jgi:hypothetical protein
MINFLSGEQWASQKILPQHCSPVKNVAKENKTILGELDPTAKSLCRATKSIIGDCEGVK